MIQKNRRIARVIAALLALAVIGGSIFFIFGQGNTGAPSGFLPAAAARAEGFKTLKKGDSGREVRAVQKALSELGYYSGKADGNFSKALEAAVLAFQKDFGLEETGRLDEETYLFLTEDQEDAPAKDPAAAKPDATAPPDKDLFVIRGEAYTDKGHVAAYLRAFGELPPNYITKEEAQALGWVSIRHNLWDVAPGKSIGGDRFGNYEGQLPTVKGRKYYECDIDFNGKYRNDKRIVYSNDGRIFYTDDHYDTFEEME